MRKISLSCCLKHNWRVSPTPISDTARRCAEKLGLERVTDNYHDLLEDESIQAIVICSPTDTHARIIEECAQSGKHIFCEKPIDHDLRRIDRRSPPSLKAQVKLQIGFNRRFDPNFSAVRQAVETARIGEPHILSITSRDPAPPPIEYVRVSGGLFLDMMIHDFNMARYLIASKSNPSTRLVVCASTKRSAKQATSIPP